MTEDTLSKDFTFKIFKTENGYILKNQAAIDAEAEAVSYGDEERLLEQYEEDSDV